MNKKFPIQTDTQPVQLSVRLWPGPDKDLITWLSSLDGLPRGGKGERIKETLRQGIRLETDLYPVIKEIVTEMLAQHGLN